MSEQEAKDVEVAEAESMYNEAKQAYRDAQQLYADAMKALQLWNEEHKGVAVDPLHPELLQLKKDLNDADQRLNNADQRLNNANQRMKDARATAEKSPKRQKVDVSDEWIKDLKGKVVAIPEDGNALRAFLQNELRMKIPLSPFFFDLISASDTQRLTTDVCEKLFTPSAAVSPTTNTIVNPVICAQLPTASHPTESTYHLLWDSLIAIVLTNVSDGWFLRDSNRNTSTHQSRPDFCFYTKHHNICLFRGEEKAYGDFNDPLSELTTKLTWIYDDAPYLLGYAAVGLQLELATIQRGEKGTTVQRIEHYDLGSLYDRLRLFLALLNLTTLFRPIAEKVKRRFIFPEYGIISRENGVEIRFGKESVVKKYPDNTPDDLVDSIISHLKTVHTLMTESFVPNVIQLVRSNVSKNTVVLTPIGYPEVPRDLKELAKALLDILDALVPMHKLKIMHRDLRWDNILRYSPGDPKWFIIDFDDSALRTKKGRHRIIHEGRVTRDMDPKSHAPEVRKSNHDEKVDIWSIGYLIQTSNLGLSQDLSKVMNDCLQDNPKKRPTALVLQRRIQKILGKN